MRHGVRLGVDVGTVRVGLAACDPDGLLAYPLEVIARDAAGNADAVRIVTRVAEHAAVEVVVGLPVRMDGKDGPAAQAARRYAAGLSHALAGVPVRLVDERLTTVTADAWMRQARPRRGARERRSTVDAVAAAVLLQSALDVERSTGRPPGEVV